MSLGNALAQHWDRWLAPLVVVLVLGSVGWPAYRDYAARKEVREILVPLTQAVQRSMAAACADGSFASKKTPVEFGIPDPTQVRGVSKLDLVADPNRRVRLVLTLTEFGDVGLDYTCSANKQLSFRLAPSTTVASKLIPVSLSP